MTVIAFFVREIESRTVSTMFANSPTETRHFCNSVLPSNGHFRADEPSGLLWRGQTNQSGLTPVDRWNLNLNFGFQSKSQSLIPSREAFVLGTATSHQCFRSNRSALKSKRILPVRYFFSGKSLSLIFLSLVCLIRSLAIILSISSWSFLNLVILNFWKWVLFALFFHLPAIW